MNSRTALTLILVAASISTSHAKRVQVIPLEEASIVHDMSPDGRFVVGTSVNGLPFIHDFLNNTFTELPAGPRDAVAVSDDGNTVLGSDMPNPDGVNGSVASIWRTGDTDWQSLGYLPDALNCPSKSDGYDLSADGSVAVGLSWDGCSGRAFRWTEATGMVEMEGLANGGNRASIVSADGNLIAGFAQGSFSRTPAIWDGTTGEGTLLDPPNGDAVGEVYGIRDDGSKLLGNVTGDAVSWTDNGGVWEQELIGNGSFRPGWSGIPTDIADDGTVVGFDILPASGIRRAWLTNSDGQIEELGQFVVANGGELPIVNGAPLILEVARNVSTNGRVVIGHGFLTTPWRVEIYDDCDLDSNFACDVDDADLLVQEIISGANDEGFDLNGDGLVDQVDLELWLADAGATNLPSGNPYIPGDADLNGVVDVSDFNIWNGNKFTATARWSLADFNADGQTDVSDFNIWNSNKFTGSDALAVPEPSTVFLGLFAMVLTSLFIRRRKMGTV